MIAWESAFVSQGSVAVPRGRTTVALEPVVSPRGNVTFSRGNAAFSRGNGAFPRGNGIFSLGKMFAGR